MIVILTCETSNFEMTSLEYFRCFNCLCRWWYSLAGYQNSNDAEIELSYFLKATGFWICVGGYAYLRLPIDIIPDFIPFFGKIDDGICVLAMLLGAALFISGFLIPV